MCRRSYGSPAPVSAATMVVAVAPVRPWTRSDRRRRASMLVRPRVRLRVLPASRQCRPDCWLPHWPVLAPALARAAALSFSLAQEAAAWDGSEPPLPQAVVLPPAQLQ